MNRRLIILAISLFAVMAADAQNIIRPKVECPNGIYVNSYNGVLFYQRPDVSVTNRNMRLEAVFYYNSSSNKINYGYGNGWSLGSELRYIEDSLGIIIEQGDGRQDLYTRYGNSFEAPAGVFSTLSIEGNGYLLTYKDGTKYYFADAESKKVTQVKDRYNNAITFTYQEGNLVAASDISGRSLHFSWSNGLLNGISTSFDDRTWNYQYDENGNLTSVTDPMGYTVRYAYNKDNRIKTFIDAEGYSTHISYNVDGMAHRVKTEVTDKSIRYEIAKRQTIFIDYLPDANNQYSKYVWDEQGRLAEIVNVNTGASTKFAYDDDNNLVRREDANGHAYTFTYDQNGNCLSTTDPLGNTEYYTYESTFNKVTSYTDKMGHYYNYQYDAHGDLLQMNGPLNYSLSITYNQYGQPITVTNSNGNSSHFGYDTYGNLSSLTDPMGNVSTTVYNIAGMPVSRIKPNGAVSTFVYNNAECLVEAINALGFSIKMEYDHKGNVVGYTDALNNTSNMSYDAIGQITKIVNPNGAIIRFEYSGNRLAKMYNALNQVSSVVYDDNNCATITMNAANEITRTVYDNVGNIVGVELPNGEHIVYQYDALGRIVSVSDQIGVFFEYYYDADDNIIQRKDALGHSEYYTYDALNRLIQHVDVMGNSEYFSYDNNGNLQTYLSKNGNATVITYDANGNILTHTDALNYVTTYGYNFNGDIVSVTDANGNTTTYEYDLLQQLKKTTYPNGNTCRYWYNGNGKAVMQENEAGEQITFTYDAANRLTGVNEVGNPNVYSIFQYDLAGNMLEAANQNAISVFTYDPMGRLMSETTNGKQTLYQYDISNNTIQITYPSGKYVTEVYDCRSRIMNVMEDGASSASFEYNNADVMTKRSYANGLETFYAYDALGRIESMTDNRNALDYQFVYDAVNNLIARKDNAYENESQAFVYDALNRLIDYKAGVINEDNTVSNPIEQIAYSLDGLGNRITMVTNGMTTTYVTNAMNAYSSTISNGMDRLFSYDVKGNLSEDGVHNYGYDCHNRICDVDNGSVIYKYDALNRLVQIEYSEGGQSLSECRCYAGDRMIEEFVDGSLTSSYTYGVSSKDILHWMQGSSSYYYQKDQRGSVIELIDNNATTMERYRYDPFGNVDYLDGRSNTKDNSAYGNGFLFGGMCIDVNTATYQESGRNMNTELGRYTEMDPMGYASSMNSYSYATNNPSSLQDDLDGLFYGLGYVGGATQVAGYFNYFNLYNLGSNGKWYTGKILSKMMGKGHEFYGNGSVSIVGSGTPPEIAQGINNVGSAITIGSALWEANKLRKEVLNTNTFEDELYYRGIYYYNTVFSTVLTPFVTEPLRLIGADEAVGELYSKVGKGMDRVFDELMRECEQFKQTGYENAPWYQKAFAQLARVLPTNEYFYMTGLGISDRQAEVIYYGWNLMSNTFNSIKKWFVDVGPTSAYTGTLVGPGSVAPVNW